MKTWPSEEENEVYVDCFFRGFGDGCETPIEPYFDGRWLADVTVGAIDPDVVGSPALDFDADVKEWADRVVLRVLEAREARVTMLPRRWLGS